MYRMLVVFLLFWPVSVQATQDMESANYILSKCKLLETQNAPQDNVAGLCLGIDPTPTPSFSLPMSSTKSTITSVNPQSPQIQKRRPSRNRMPLRLPLIW
jgi:hypothetical protein